MDKVEWRIKGLFKADAQKVYEEIGEAAVTPREVLEKAKDKKSELHKCFEWNDTVAANKFRLDQAARIIRNLVIIPKSEELMPERVFQISTDMTVYKPVREILRNEEEYQALLARATAELRNIKNRYNSIVELEEVFEAIDAL